MFDWKKTVSIPLTLKVQTPIGTLVVGSNWSKKQRVESGHTNKMKRFKSVLGRMRKAPTQCNGYKSTAGYKYIGTCNVNNNRKTFYGNNIELVKKLVENHYRQILKQLLVNARG